MAPFPDGYAYIHRFYIDFKKMTWFSVMGSLEWAKEEALKNYEHWSESWNNGNELDGLSFSVEIERKGDVNKVILPCKNWLQS